MEDHEIYSKISALIALLFGDRWPLFSSANPLGAEHMYTGFLQNTPIIYGLRGDGSPFFPRHLTFVAETSFGRDGQPPRLGGKSVDFCAGSGRQLTEPRHIDTILPGKQDAESHRPDRAATVSKPIVSNCVIWRLIAQMANGKLSAQRR